MNAKGTGLRGKEPDVRLPAGLSAPPVTALDLALEDQLRDLKTVREIADGLDRLEAILDKSPIPQAVTQRGYFTPDEDDRVRQGLLSYRNYRLAAYDVILRHRHYASLETPDAQLRAFLLAFGTALLLYAKSVRIVAFAEHVPLLRAKLNEPDMKFGLEAGFFDDVLACYTQLSNFRSLRAGAAFWQRRRRQIQVFARTAGGDWPWLTSLIVRQRQILRRRLLDVLWRRLRYDWRAFVRSLRSPFQQARRGLESVIGGMADVQLAAVPTSAIGPEILRKLRPELRPGDVLLMRTDSRITTAILPGFWAHAALFLGTRWELESMGLRENLHVARHWPTIAQHTCTLGLVLEAVYPAVRLTAMEQCLCVDHLLVLRPALPEKELATAIAEAIGQLGKPYDFDFDFNNSSRIVCTELIYRSFHGRGGLCFTLGKRLGRFTLIGDDIVTQFVTAPPDGRSSPPFNPVALLLKHRDGHLRRTNPERTRPLLRRLVRGWRPTRRVLERRDPEPESALL